MTSSLSDMEIAMGLASLVLILGVIVGVGANLLLLLDYLGWLPL